MAISISELRINGIKAASDPIDITPEGFSISWDLGASSSDQSSISMRISAFSTGHGTDSFGSEILKFINIPSTGRVQRINFRKLLSRNQILFGQARLSGTDGTQTGWYVFKISVPVLPFVLSASLSPSSPSMKENIDLSYVLSAVPSSGVDIKWYKNGVEQFLLKNNKVVPFDSLSPGDIWHSEIRPYNTFGEGISFTTSTVAVKKPIPEISQLDILPRGATVDDILEVVYKVTDTGNSYNNIEDETVFDWFVNGSLVAENYGKFARLNTQPGDEVFVRAKPKILGFESSVFTSDLIFVKKSEVTITDILIDGNKDGGITYNPSPVITWSVDQNKISDVTSFKIKLGTANGSAEFGEFDVGNSVRSFKIPSSLLSSGSEYVVTIIPVSADGTSAYASYAKFITNGSLWRDEVDNAIGWTVSMKVSISADDDQLNSGYACVISDGSYTFRLEFFKSLTRVVASSNVVVETVNDNSLASSFLIGVVGDDLLVYRNGSLIFNVAHALSIRSSEKSIRFEPIVKGQECTINLFNMFVSVLGRKLPNDPGYGDVSFYRFATFPGSEVSALAEYGGKVLIGVNSRESFIYPSLYEFNPVAPKVVCDISSFNNNLFNINAINSSKVGDVVGIATSYGVTTIAGGNPSSWDSLFDYNIANSFSTSGWNYYSDNVNLITFPSGKIRINTNPVSGSIVIPQINNGKISIFSIQQRGVIESYSFSYNNTTKTITATRNPSFPNLIANLQFVLSSDKTIEQLVSEMLSTNVSSTANTNINMSFLYSISVMNEYESIASSYVSSMTIGENNYIYDFYASSSELNMVGSDGVINTLPSASRGGAYIYQNSAGTSWYENVSSENGYTFEVELSVNAISEALDSSSGSSLSNLSFADGAYESNIEIFDNYIKCGSKTANIDMTSPRKLRFSSKKGQVKLYDIYSENSAELMSFSMNKISGDIGDVISVKSTYIGNDVHAIALIKYGLKSNYYHRIYRDGNWLDYGKVISEDGDYGNFDIAQVGNDIVIAFEIASSGRGEIAVARRSAVSWSSPLRITSAIGESKNPQVAVDDTEGIHVVWEDNRTGVYRICYASQSNNNYEWNSSAFGKQDIMLTSNDNSCSHPGILYSNGRVYVTYQLNTPSSVNQSSSINLVYKNLSNGSWTGYAGSGAEVQVSNVSAVSPRNPFITKDNNGNIHVLWTALVLVGSNQRYRVHHRFFDPNFTITDNTIVVPPTADPKDSYIKSVGYDIDKNIVMLGLVKSSPAISTGSQVDSASISSDYLENNEAYYTYFKCSNNQWRSSQVAMQNNSAFSITDFILPKQNRSTIPSIYITRNHPDNPGLALGRSISFNSVHYGNSINLLIDPYLSIDDIVFGIDNKKYIKIGDFGGIVGIDMTISQLAISGRSALSPLRINTIYPSKYNMPAINISSVHVSSNADAWMAGENRLLFYDSVRDSVFEATSGDFYTTSRLDQYIDETKKIIDIFFDKYGCFYIHMESSSGESQLLASLSGGIFSEIIIDNNFSAIRIDKFGNAVFIAPDGVRVIEQFSSLIRNNLIEYAISNSSSEESFEMPDSILAYPVLAEAYGGVLSNDNILYFATNVGLIKYKSIEDISIFENRIGLNQSIVKFVSTNSENRVFCATSTSVLEFIGNNFYEIDIYGYDRSGSSIPPGVDSDITGVSCLDDILVVTTRQSAYFAEEVIGRGSGSFWTARKLPKSSLTLNQNDLQSSIVRDRIKISSIDIAALGGLSLGVVPEILINGHRISRGFAFSPYEKVIIFYAPLLPSDKVSLILRKDIYKIVELKQNESEIAAIGRENRKILEVGIIEGDFSCVIGGTRHHIDSWNSQLSIPSDDIVLDRVPPSGKASISEVVGNNIIKIRIDPLSGASGGTDQFDAVSGIDKIVVSNYDNFTVDGTNPLDPVPFNSEIMHTLNPVSSSGNLLTEIPAGYGTCMAYVKFAGDVRGRAVYATGSPAAVFVSDSSLKFSDSPSMVFSGGSLEFEVTAMCSYKNKLFVSVSRRDGSGNSIIYMSENGEAFAPISGVSGYKISGMAVSNFDNKMYISVSSQIMPSGNLIGELYSYNDSSIQLVASNLNSRANAVACIDRFVYVGTGSPARIYRYDISSGLVEIVMSEQEEDVTALTTVGSGIYAGMSATSRIMRSNNPSSEFIQSFISTPNDVLFGTAFDVDAKTIPYFGVGNILFAYSNAWYAAGRSDTNIVGACIDEFGTILYLSTTEIKALSITTSSLRNVFVKLIDRAGNETEIRSLPDEVPTGGDGYNDNLTIRISSQSTEGQNLLVDNGMSNTLVEYDLNGVPLLTLPGDSQFYSGFRVEEEMGVYESPILSGASGHVAWGTIQWTGSMPAGTDIEILLRSGSTRNAVLNAPYSVRYSWPESGANISFMPGSFIQFQIRMRTATSVSPRVDSLTITESAGSTSNVITTMFELPSNMRRGIITTDSQLPSGAAIIAGITLKDSTDFAEFQEVSLDRLFEPASYNNGDKLRIGFKLISPSSENNIQSTTPTGCNSLPLSLNTMQWSYENELVGAITVDFRVIFYNDFTTNDQVLSVDTISSPQLFKIDGNNFPTGGGAIFASGQQRNLSLIPSGFPFVCDTCYYVQLYASIDGASFSAIPPAKSAFKKQCGVNFLDVISFAYQNRSANGRFHFRISLYNDISRNDLVTSFFSYYSNVNWSADGFAIASDGVPISNNQSKTIQFIVPRVDELVSEKTYYITIQAYNLDDPDAGFSFNDTSYSLRLRPVSDGVSCGTSSNVPVIRGFCMMFELDNGSLVKMRFDA